MHNFGKAVLLLAAALPAGAQKPVFDDFDLTRVQWLTDQKPTDAKVMVVGRYENPGELRLDLDHLEALQKRLGERGVQVVALLREAPAEPVKALAATIPVGHPPSEDPRTGEAPDPTGLMPRGDLYLDRVAVLDLQRKVRWQGAPAFGLSWFVEQALAGRLGTGSLAAAVQLRTVLLAQFGEIAGIELKPQVERLLQLCPRDGTAWAMRYMLEVERFADAAAAAATASTACQELAPEPVALAVFADLALRSDPGNRGLGRTLVEALTPAAASVPRDVRVQLALLRALVRAGADREVGRVSSTVAKAAGEYAELSLLLAEILADAGLPAVHKDLAQRALDRAGKLGAAPLLLAAARCKVALRCGDDLARAKQLNDEFATRFAQPMTLNSCAWQFMTRLETKGRYDPLALDLCQRMQEQGNLNPSYVDTVAVAMFVNGRLQEAVDLQRQAITGGGNKPTFAERLLRYETALRNQTAGK